MDDSSILRDAFKPVHMTKEDAKRPDQYNAPDGRIRQSDEIGQRCEESGDLGDHFKDWGTPIEFRDTPLVEFPVASLPEPIQSAVITVAESVGSSNDIAAAVALACFSFATARLVPVEINRGHVEPTNIWFVPIAPPGGGKSPTQKKLMKPIRQWEHSERERLAPKINEEQAEYDTTKAELEGDLRKLTRLDRDKRDGLRGALIERQGKFKKRSRPELPRFVVGDFTEAALSGIAARAGGTIFIMDDEGATIWQSIGGRYSGDGGSQASVFVKLWAGAHHDEVRETRDSHDFNDAQVSVVLSPIQPDMLRDVKNLKQLKAQGVLDRFVPHVAEVSPVPAEPPTVDDSMLDAYSSTLTSLLGLKRHEPQPGEPYGLTLSVAARTVRSSFIDEVNARVTGGDLESYSGGVAKLRANIERLAGVFHMAKNPNEAAYRRPITGETMADAVKVGRYWLSHMISLHGTISKPPVVANAERVLRWVSRQIEENALTDGGFANQTLWQWFKSKRSSSVDLSEALSLLMEHEFLRLVTDRPKTFAVNPLWADRVRRGEKGSDDS